MKNPFYLLVLALLGSACQQQSPPATASTAAPEAPAAETAPEVKPTPPALSVTLSPEVLALLRQTDLAPLWNHYTSADLDLHALEGFYGADNSRFSLVLTQVERDSLAANVFHVAGKTRYKDAIEPVVGDIIVAQLADFYLQDRLYSVVDSAGDPAASRAYSALANVVLHGQRQLGSQLYGTASLDFYIDAQGKIGEIGIPDGVTVDKQAPSKGAGLLLEGQWLNGPAGPSRPFVLSRNVFIVAKSLFKDFGVGDRGMEINPKYARLGWNRYWENDEWWADAQKPALSL